MSIFNFCFVKILMPTSVFYTSPSLLLNPKFGGTWSKFSNKTHNPMSSECGRRWF